MMFSDLTGETKELGPATEDLDAILGLGEQTATFAPEVIVYVEGPVLQKWEGQA